jgi:hypothetical protein
VTELYLKAATEAELNAALIEAGLAYEDTVQVQTGEDEASGSNLALPDPTVTPGADGVACFVQVGSKWLMTSYSVNDGA